MNAAAVSFVTFETTEIVIVRQAHDDQVMMLRAIHRRWGPGVEVRPRAGGEGWQCMSSDGRRVLFSGRIFVQPAMLERGLVLAIGRGSQKAATVPRRTRPK